ncbi:uncharacterized protein FA14DRAFT_71867 [Meira miltonrushii]|uniref:Uncharacterized protein n=1 Tax=Meira miltonrushii TaxID=1280837 RepID=A0A316VA83_9BASI|nr:uncharacterized protein FA14DRAFT_71867 [Meira miltonrushii]PWN34372.1 hypothetical protein FA14DRAFT_71867 [Meira miltonrushii]
MQCNVPQPCCPSFEEEATKIILRSSCNAYARERLVFPGFDCSILWSDGVVCLYTHTGTRARALAQSCMHTFNGDGIYFYLYPFGNHVNWSSLLHPAPTFVKSLIRTGDKGRCDGNAFSVQIRLSFFQPLGTSIDAFGAFSVCLSFPIARHGFNFPLFFHSSGVKCMHINSLSIDFI